MKLFVRRTGGRIGLWGGLLAAALAAFAAGWLVPVRAPVGCRLNELTAAPDFSPFSPAAPVVAASDAGTPAAPSLPEKWVCLTFDDGPSKTTPAVLAALDAAGVHGTFFVVATGYNEKYLPLLTQAAAAGHQIALHSASHEYSDIYRSSAAYWKDIALLKERIAPYVDAENIRYLRFPGGVCRRQPGQAEGIRLDGISPCRQILPVDSQHPRRVGQVGLLALHPGSRLIIGTHGTIKKQGAGL